MKIFKPSSTSLIGMLLFVLLFIFPVLSWFLLGLLTSVLGEPTSDPNLTLKIVDAAVTYLLIAVGAAVVVIDIFGNQLTKPSIGQVSKVTAVILPLMVASHLVFSPDGKNGWLPMVFLLLVFALIVSAILGEKRNRAI